MRAAQNFDAFEAEKRLVRGVGASLEHAVDIYTHARVDARVAGEVDNAANPHELITGSDWTTGM